MTLNVVKNDSNITIKLSGRLDTITAPSLERAIGEVISETQSLVLDMNELQYVSSAGLRVLLGAEKNARKLGGSMKLIGVGSDIMEILEMTGFADILTIERA